MKHTELSRDQVKSQLAALQTRRAKTGDIQLLFYSELLLWKLFHGLLVLIAVCASFGKFLFALLQ